MWTRKTMAAIVADEASAKLTRQLRLVDLIAIGIGGTVGSGVFATTGLIIAHSAGPAAVISWVIGGLVCLLNGVAYMELSCLVPSSGSTYAYAYHALGELPAAVAGWLLCLEYGISGAGVARSWGTKVQAYCETTFAPRTFTWLNEDYYSIASVLVESASVIIVLLGVPVGTRFVNVMTTAKVLLVLFIICASLSVFTISNVTPFLPPRNASSQSYGPQGLVVGVTQAFFGYIGFDEVCCLAAEASDPRTAVPRAVLGTILGTMVLSAMASLALAGMQPCANVVDFASAFEAHGMVTTAHIVRVGELLTMPVVVFVSFLAQPRVTYAMATDGLLPPIFARVDGDGRLRDGTLLTGGVCTLLAFCVPFEHLWEIISFAILIAFNLANASVLLLRVDDARHVDVARTVWALLGCSGLGMFAFQYGLGQDNAVCLVVAVLLLAGAIVATARLVHPEPRKDTSIYRAPWLPWLPALATTLNWFLLAQMTRETIVLGCLWMLVGAGIYFAHGARYSVHHQTRVCVDESYGLVRASTKAKEPVTDQTRVHLRI
ncbi:hypothetical protein SDRG_08241 [Saprolegnia diclina VS20]|uniref:Cationic amino acid transporter C-terminal domain-containing protein n=1 Tax=Saprolegnia diclina (strain VS20) TaxID=1156394 RepID=T0QJV3_SAPDV|nr:hypothetical protein SDRG_08241 [Saprolegnia diclina VS20]EQC34025.1 hypothetical protein SDRG_08241 [Saprolegnia diclina VS20]|eukprot:XP_008612337.1 hypothetical protein SDRG_08241 [Saprolegnia diclina VS20]